MKTFVSVLCLKKIKEKGGLKRFERFPHLHAAEFGTLQMGKSKMASFEKLVAREGEGGEEGREEGRKEGEDRGRQAI